MSIKRRDFLKGTAAAAGAAIVGAPPSSRPRSASTGA
ncbi:twin-arginine translocation signal domain-containing protein [Thioalkalivibrio sulfidiphilus]|nr:twin-arginine translocation signal domain-containing protein [Thioalkalivibrio sulfidiphilus]